jgi:CRP-like cAMP-binding protein
VEKIAVLKTVSLFSGLDPQTLEQLASIAEPRSFAAGQPIYAEGEADAAIFIVASGTVRIDKQVSAGQQQTLAQVKEAEFFGHMSFVLGGAHSVSAEAVRDVEVLMIRRTEFDRLAARNPTVGYKIMLHMAEQLAKMLRDMDEKFVELVGYVYGRGKK